MIRTVLRIAALATVSVSPWLASGQSISRVRVTVASEGSSTIEPLRQILTQQLQQRCPTTVVTTGAAPVVVELSVCPDQGVAEGFSISDGPPGTICIRGHDARGLLYGVGKFLRTSRYTPDGLTPSPWRGTDAPERPVRGIYLATHFHNFYHDAPVEEVQRYVEELGLWGFNTVLLWYDLHHFQGFHDPAAIQFRQRLRSIAEAARRIGLDVGFAVLANEAYANSPPELRADPRGRRGGWYDCDICPNQPGGLEYIREVLGQWFDECADLGPRYLCIWPYDQGGCGCDACRPWGSRGFLHAAEPIAALARQKFPGVQTILATWMFDDTEREGLAQSFTRTRPGYDYLLAEEASPKTPRHLPRLGFPEISMYEMFPWGGFGATPLPNHFQRQWDAAKGELVGGFPYSEGIFEDLNKVLFSQFYWNDRPAQETLAEYAAYEFGPETVDKVLRVIAILEQNHHMRWWPGELEGVKLELDWFPSRGVPPQSDPNAEEALQLVQQIDAQMSAQARHAWRWRQVYLRALLDAELKQNHGSPTAACQAAFRELIQLYHAEQANPGLRPPLEHAAEPE